LKADAFKEHSDLRHSDLDLSTILSMDELMKFQANHLKLEKLCYRDEDIAMAIKLGCWHQVAVQKMARSAAALVNMPALKVLEVYMEPIEKIGKKRFKNADNSKDGFEILATRFHEHLVNAAQAIDVQCNVDTIVLMEQARVITEDEVSADGLPEGRPYEF
jgi:hypothetical protein